MPSVHVVEHDVCNFAALQHRLEDRLTFFDCDRMAVYRQRDRFHNP
jgi:hypothetical protein